MARATETGFYFEPLAGRLALVVEGSPFPSDDQWAHVGDPIEMTPEVARLQVADRWPGVDPDALQLELDLNFERALAEHEKELAEVAQGFVPRRGEIDFDLNLLLEQAELLRLAAEQLRPLNSRARPEQLFDANGESIGAYIIKSHQ